MKIFGIDITIGKTSAAPAPVVKATHDALSPAFGNEGWFPLVVRESFTGAWQHDISAHYRTVLSNSIVFACTTLIARDIAKMGVKLMQKDQYEIWNEIENSAYDPVLRDPNDYQNWMQFIEIWMLSKMSRGNTYILKVRDQRGVVTDLYPLHPDRVRLLISDDGQKFYELQTDNVSGLTEATTVPASEIIHDRWNCMFHPMIGLSPIFACYAPAIQGIEIQNNSSTFFRNKSMPGGFLTAPGAISKDTATRLKTDWDTNFTGANAGKIAVAGDGLKYENITISAIDSQLIEQLKLTGETICSVFHIPPHMVGIGPMPSNANVQASNLQYYQQALQSHIEEIEYCFDDGLGFAKNIGIQLNVENLLRMDTLTLIQSLGEGVSRALITPNEGRKKLNYKPVKGGDSCYLQQQNFSLEALAKRDAQDDPFKSSAPAPAANPNAPQDPNATDQSGQDQTAKALEELRKGLAA